LKFEAHGLKLNKNQTILICWANDFKVFCNFAANVFKPGIFTTIKDIAMRKQIIVAVDFSKNSLHALEYAVLIGNVLRADVMLVWVDKPESEYSLYTNEVPDIRKEAKKRMEDLVKKYKTKLKGGTLTFRLRKGKVYKEIANMAKYHDAYVVIAGAHGVSGYEAFWIGSNANKIVANCECQVITIRDGFKIKKNIHKVIVPIDNSNSTRQKVPFAMDFAKCFCSEIHLLELQSSSLKAVRAKVSSYTQQVAKYLDEHKVKYLVKSVNADNITLATIEYAKEVGADLIIIMTEQEEATQNIWLGPYAQQMVNHSPIPVMSVHPKTVSRLEK
jgi:nucleotide-binding universal stress UspA family protein